MRRWNDVEAQRFELLRGQIGLLPAQVIVDRQSLKRRVNEANTIEGLREIVGELIDRGLKV